MKYGKIINGRLIKKVNRFIAEVFINGIKEQLHIKNTGRLKELLIPDAEVLLEFSDNPDQRVSGQRLQSYLRNISTLQRDWRTNLDFNFTRFICCNPTGVCCT